MSDRISPAIAGDDSVEQPEFVRRYTSRQSVLAVQLTEDADWEAIAAWCCGELCNHTYAPGGESETWLHIDGGYEGTTDDWVIQCDTEDGPDFRIVMFDEFDELFATAPSDGLDDRALDIITGLEQDRERLEHDLLATAAVLRGIVREQLGSDFIDPEVGGSLAVAAHMDTTQLARFLAAELREPGSYSVEAGQ